MEDEYELLSLVLRERIESYEKPLCVVSARWSASDFPLNRPDFLATAFPRLERETVEDGARKSQVKTDVEPRFDADLCCVILSSKQSQQFFQETMQGKSRTRDDGWDRFYVELPLASGIVQLSRVGFNARRDQALLCLGLQSHWLCGSGDYMLLRKLGGRWIIEHQTPAWIS